MSHVHQESKTCKCSMTALEPNEDCPIHGYPRPPKCEICGQFVKRPSRSILKESQLHNFNNDEALASEYSIFYGCPESDSGYHCCCYDEEIECHLCDQKINEEEKCVLKNL